VAPGDLVLTGLMWHGSGEGAAAAGSEAFAAAVSGAGAPAVGAGEAALGAVPDDAGWRSAVPGTRQPERAHGPTSLSRRSPLIFRSSARTTARSVSGSLRSRSRRMCSSSAALRVAAHTR